MKIIRTDRGKGKTTALKKQAARIRVIYYVIAEVLLNIFMIQL